MALFLPVITRTLRPAVAGTPVWEPEDTEAAITHNLVITIPDVASAKLVVEWASDGAEFPTSTQFDPGDLDIEMIEVDGAFDELGDLRCGAWYLDTPPAGEVTITITSANAIWHAARAYVVENARAGQPQAATIGRTDTAISIALGENGVRLLDAYSHTSALVIADGLGDGDLTPLSGQTAGEDGEVNETFLAAHSERSHRHSGPTSIGWGAASEADMLMLAINVLFSAGQIAAASYQEISRWPFAETGTVFADDHGLSNASIVSGAASGGQDPLYSGGEGSLRVQGTVITASSVPQYQQQSYTIGGYCQVSALPVSGNRPLLGKDSGLPVPGGFQAEIETTGALDVYIRGETGLAGTAVHVTGDDGSGEVTVDIAFLWALAYDGPTQTANVFFWEEGGEPTVLATKTNAGFFGLDNNTAGLSCASRAGTPGVELDGVIGAYFFGAGAMTFAEFSNLAEPTSIVEPDAPGSIVMRDIALGTLAASSTTDIDPTEFGTGFGDPVGALTLVEVSDAASQMSFLNNPSDADNDPAATIRITAGAAPASTTNRSATATVAEDGGTPSNVFTITWTEAGTQGAGDFTPFPFVTISNPTVTHVGVAARPDFSAGNPRGESIVDPMSGIEIFRVGGNSGASVFEYQTGSAVDSGLNFPNRLRDENSPRMGNVWNPDSTLLMVGRRFVSGTEPSSPAGSYLIDVTGQYTGGPWRIIRAGNGPGLGEAGQWWFWDPLIPTRAYRITGAGAIEEWWPVGGSGHSVGEINTVHPARAGFGNHNSGRRHMIACSWDGQFYVTGCRETGGAQRWGGYRINLLTGAFGPFIPDGFGEFVNNSNHSTQGTSATGLYTTFQRDGNHHRVYRTTDGEFMSDTGPNTMSHIEMTLVNGVEYVIGGHSDSTGFRLFNMVTGQFTTKASFPMANPQHTGCLNTLDLFETYGSAGGGNTGQRYGILTKSNDRGGHSRGIYGIRLGPNDDGEIRLICNHRSNRTTNGNEVHPQISPDGRYVVFPSNWAQPGVATDGHVHPYVAIIPDAWYSPNNDGSAV